MKPKFKPLYYDTDSVQVNKSIAEQNKEYCKWLLNAWYGFQPSILQENKMERKFIVIHQHNKAGIVFKDSIEAILPCEDEVQHVEICLKGTSIFATDKYEDVVKQMFV